MKKIFSLLLILVLFVPVMVRAEDTEDTPEVISANKEPVNLYIFRSDTCGYCKALMEWLNSDDIQEKYGAYFKIVDFEVSGSQDNTKLMQKVKDYFKVTSQGVPYIVIGKYDYPDGFASDAFISGEENITMGDQLINQIKELYEVSEEERFDVFKELNIDPFAKKDNTLAVGIISGIVIITIVGGIIVARKNS